NWFLPHSHLKNFLFHTWKHWTRMTKPRHTELLYSLGHSNSMHAWPHSTVKTL
ncbi:hypothetical protein L208DRAFT_1395000, partial [Tricholoma matsutake]